MIARTSAKKDVNSYYREKIQDKQKVLQLWNTFVSVILSWCSIKDDYRTLAGLEDANIVNLHDDTSEVNGDRPRPTPLDNPLPLC